MNKINRRKAQKAKCLEDIILKRIRAKEDGDWTLWTTKEIRLCVRARVVLQTGNAALAKVVPRYYLKELCQLEDPSGRALLSK